MLSYISRFGVAGAFIVILDSVAPAKVIHVDIQKLVFNPKSVTAQVGDTIEWENHDIVAHTATADDKSWDVVIPPRAIGTYVVEGAGVIPYFCRFHPNMRGQIEAAAR